MNGKYKLLKTVKIINRKHIKGDQYKMLSNPEMLATVEATCRERGVIDKFEAENGEIKGHMMIDVVKMPDNVSLYPNVSEDYTAFEASFDFMDSKIGFAFCTKSIKAVSDFWCWNGRDDKEPDKVWIELFVQTLVESIEPDGSYGVPIYTFISDTGSFSVVPSNPNDV
jgi:hypothetical protein